MSAAPRFAAVFAATLLAALLALLVLPSQSSAADGMDSAKKAGYVGERFDGYLGLVDAAAPKEVKALVDEINAKRRKAYEALAAKNKVELQVIENVAGEKAIKRTKNGQFVMPPDEEWTKK